MNIHRFIKIIAMVSATLIATAQEQEVQKLEITVYKESDLESVKKAIIEQDLSKVQQLLLKNRTFNQAELKELLHVADKSINEASESLGTDLPWSKIGNLIKIGTWSIFVKLMFHEVVDSAVKVALSISIQYDRPHYVAAHCLGYASRLWLLAQAVIGVSENIDQFFKEDRRFVALAKACTIRKTLYDLKKLSAIAASQEHAVIPAE